MIKNRCSPVSLVLFVAIGAFLIGAVSAQAGSGPSAALAASSNGVNAAVRSIQPAVSGLFQVKAPRVWNNGVPGFLDTWDAFQSRTSSAILGKAYAFTTIDGLSHEVLYAGVERASSKSPVVFEFSQLEGERSVGDLRIEAEIDNAGSIGTVQFQSYSGDGAKAGLKLLPIAILAGEGCNDAGTACVVANGASLEVGANLSQLLNGSEGRFKTVKITTPEDSVVGTFAITATAFTPYVDGCLSDPTSFGSVPGCTANDISLTAVQPGTCNFNNNTCTGECDATNIASWSVATCGTVDLVGCIGQFLITAVTRYDVGLYISTDGDPNADFAKSGTCSRNAWDSTAPLTSADTDLCGDVNAKGQTIGLPIPTTTILCVDRDGDDKVDISHCETWSNSAEQLNCQTSQDVKPGTTSKCNCGILAGACIPFPSDDECKENVCALRCGGVATGASCTSNADCATGVFCLDTLITRNKTNGTACGDGTTSGCHAPDTCQAGVCVSGIAPSTTICRAAAGVCDVGDSCDGSTNACPADAKQPGTTLCRAAAGVCDVLESCDGSTNACPADAKQPGTTLCRAANGVCDVLESCDGSTNACPADAKLPATTLCRAANGVCDVLESCDGTNDCPADLVVTALSNTVCRASDGSPCDPPEVCDGTNKVCPPIDLCAGGTRADVPKDICTPVPD